jgi:hypothetical protein
MMTTNSVFLAGAASSMLAPGDCRGDAEALLQVVNEAAGFLECQPNDGVPELHDLGGLGSGGCEAEGEEQE